ncbi:MAG: phosphoenolpyruvate--protein phosphotransferase [Anaerolineae bacterium]|nr:phosphoenolpyruvate--protein phosphotransferase [Anaerolineae bacterium]
MIQLHGIASARGIAVGPVYQFQQVNLVVERKSCPASDLELIRFDEAVQAALNQIEAVFTKAKNDLAEEQAAIFEAHRMMLQDPELIESVKKTIREQSVNAEFAVKQATEHYALMLEGMDNEYFKARAMDVRDIAQRLLRLLLGVAAADTSSLSTPSIIIASDLSPSDTILFDKHLVLGFCTVEGSETSHTAILARGLGIPAVAGCTSEILKISTGTQVILDGTQGILILDAAETVKNEYIARKSTLLQRLQNAKSRCHAAALTLDGEAVEVVANIGNLAGAQDAVENGAEGVGLLRTEFLYMERETLPSEEEQFQAYSRILEVFGDKPVVLRTSDIGGDKELPYLNLQKEMNPFLGVRGLRLALHQPAQLLYPQLRAVLRAGKGHDLRVMFPMVASLSEIRQARQALVDCRSQLLAEGQIVADHLQVGIMIEVPSAAIMADRLAPEVDFFSIGTNDLTQYTLAADRTNPQLAYLTSAFSPAVLRLIQNVILQAHHSGKWVGLCGELAGEPLALPLLLGLHLDEFSMNPPAIPLAKEILRGLHRSDCEKLVEEALKFESAEEVKNLVRERMPGVAA